MSSVGRSPLRHARKLKYREVVPLESDSQDTASYYSLPVLDSSQLLLLKWRLCLILGQQELTSQILEARGPPADELLY